jgi:A/G-specific adenine glycosylase
MTLFAQNLLTWYDRNARTLPWRVPPGSGEHANPYHVWLSEVMLQQTTVAAVKAYFEKFTARWPSVETLAAASNDEVMAAWAGLGYYSRARNLHACARIVVENHGGHFPQTEVELRKLPGIGDYTAAAIAAIAFGEKAAVVDGNIERVVTRWAGDATPLPKAKAQCRAFVDNHMPAERPGDFAQAMMDLGATICTPRSPVCALCPVTQGCTARAAGNPLDYPVKPAKKAKPQRRGAVYVALKGAEFWCVRRPEKGMLGGTAGLPTTDWSARQDGARGPNAAPFAADWEQVGEITHTFTHFGLTLEVYAADAKPTGNGWWESDTGNLPTLFAKAARLTLDQAAAPRPSR